MQNYPNIYHYLDIPLQHINDGILQSMRRNITGSEIRQLIDTIRKEVPDIALRTSLIVGYPGETKKVFNELVSFVEETRFERLGVFTYSHEENTIAYALPDRISQKEKEKRKEEIMWLQQDISLQLNQAKVGTTMEVLIDKQTRTHFEGRTRYDSPEVDNNVLLSRRKNQCAIGGFYPVKILSADAFDLTGEIIDLNREPEQRA